MLFLHDPWFWTSAVLYVLGAIILFCWMSDGGEYRHPWRLVIAAVLWPIVLVVCGAAYAFDRLLG